MRVTIKGLRLWILTAAGLLLMVVAGFIFYGRYRFRHIEKDLPGKLGINIQQTANGFTYSQSNGPHTLFTLKAAKQVQMKSGHVLLHDVDITLYGPPGSGRTDRIYGSDFDFDQNSQTATSQGDVNIELEGMGNGASGASAGAAPGPASGSAPGAASGPAPGAASNTIRVRTRGLVFEQKTGDAATTNPVEFQLPRAAGSSIGANYNSKTGTLVLNSAVKITTSSNGRAAVINADHATLLRDKLQGFLTNATVEYETEEGSADAATLYFRKDGTTEKIDAQGHVRMKSDTGATMVSDTAHILMDATSQPTQADLDGGVAFDSARDGDSMHGTARESTLHFATVTGADGEPQSALTHAQFRHDVHFTDATTGLAKDPRGHAERQVQGQTVDIDFAPPGPQGETEARKAVADGDPVVTMRQMPSKGPSTMTRISGDRLVATLAPGNVLRQLDGNGNTCVVDESTVGARDNSQGNVPRQVDGNRNKCVADESAAGSHDTSQGDVLHVTFQQQPAPESAVNAKPHHSSSRDRAERKNRSAPAAPKLQTSIDIAVQDGHVMLTELPAKKPGATTPPATLTGWADHAEYHAADDVLHLTGSPRISDGESMQVSAEAIDYHRDSQDAAAEGNVKATYTQPPKTQASAGPSAPPSMGGNGPVHVIAERAAMHHATSQNDFYGTVKHPARLWQDTDSLTAPVIEVDRNKNILKAWGENTGADPVVQANFTSAMGAKHQQTVAQVHSQTLVYSDKERQADFRGTVSMNQSDEVIHADDGRIFLKPAQTSQQKPAAGQNSQIDHVVATGHVVFTQPGRKGQGEKLVYTADDGRYILTGTPQAPPHLWDSVHGTTTGTALLFNSQDGSVEVNGGQSSAVTDTRAPR